MTNPRKPQAIINVKPGAAGFIGCSALASVLGLSEYNTPLHTYNAFMGNPEPVTEEQQAIFDRGHRMEDFIAKEIEAERGYKLRRVTGAYVHPKYSWWICHPDRLMVGRVEGKRIGVEIKSSSFFMNNRWGDEDTNDIPIDYFFQCLGYMACGVCDEVHLFRWSNLKLTRYIIQWDELRVETIEKGIAAEVTEWLKGNKPQPITLAEAYEKWSNPEGEFVADQKAMGLINFYDKLKKQEKETKEQIDQAKLEIIKLLDGKSVIVSPEGKKLHSYVKQTRKTLDSKALKEQMADIYEKFAKETESYVFR